ncbi:NAD-dependent epimerase/dehydratase family protein [Nocardioides halotolerans]|uniref:NAD-dependent epimerase/dehydratase family protein n=1 Tax=Nocardioides halotolerans TaxID=433660 RepID=UPI00048F9311|nr:NAD-dependent epimerase/dehydratase family protein [Nocardioides halotolerans]
MRLLVLGGTVFLSRAVAADAVARGHEVTCAARGTSGSVPDGARLVALDRTQPLDASTLGEFDAVVDVARHPSWVRNAVAAYADAHWVFVSTVNVYADDTTPGGTPATLPLVDAIEEDVDLKETPEAYGPMKVACERAVLDGAASAMVMRPGLIVGPGDPTGRFSYWPRRLAHGGELLAPGDPGDVMQVADVRDLAAWAVTACEQRTTGVFDGVGTPLPMADLLAQCAEGVEPEVTWTWVDQGFLGEHEVEPWSGPASIPLWLPRPEYDGLGSHDVGPSLDAGLTIRPLADTTRDTLAWLDATPDAVVGGIGLDREQELLSAWHAQVSG